MRIATLLMLAGVLAVSPVAAQSDHPLKGQWARDDGKARVKIERCGTDWCAINTWIKPGHKGEKVGDKLIMTLNDGEGDVFDGSAHDPQRNLTLKIRVTAEPETLTTRGCVLGGVICKTARWTRL